MANRKSFVYPRIHYRIISSRRCLRLSHWHALLAGFPQTVRVAFPIQEDRKRSRRHCLLLLRELNPLGAHSIKGRMDILALEPDRQLVFRPVLNHRFWVKRQAGLGVWRTHFSPARMRAHRLFAVDSETNLLRPKLNCPRLVFNIHGSGWNLSYGFPTPCYS